MPATAAVRIKSKTPGAYVPFSDTGDAVVDRPVVLDAETESSRPVHRSAPDALLPIPAAPPRQKVDRYVVAGIILALVAVAAGIVATGTNLRYFLQPAGAWIVLGGTLGVTLITTPRLALLHSLHRVVGLVRPVRVHRSDLLDEIMKYVQLARTKGLLGIEAMVLDASHPLLRDMLILAVDGTRRADLQNILETKVRLRERQGEADAKVLEVAAGFAPAIGVLGTVIGLIDVLRQFSNMNSVVLGIGTAFVSTIYGLGLANLILLPAAHRIRSSVAEAFETEEMIVQAGLCLIDGINPRLIREQLSCFVRED